MFGILSLEDDVLRLVSQHLSKTSRAIFAAAMTASSPRWAANGYSLELLEKNKIIFSAFQRSQRRRKRSQVGNEKVLSATWLEHS